MAKVVERVLRAAAELVVEGIAGWNRKRLPADALPYVTGVHRPMGAELTLSDLVVEGELPAGLRGRYLKMGANPVRADAAGHHWFMGDGMVHAIALGEGRARWYRNRWIGSELAAKALGREAAPGPRRGVNDTVNTNVVGIGGRVFAVVEAGSNPVELLGEGLEGQRYEAFGETLAGSFSGHPHRDPVTGEHHAVCYDGRVWDAVRHVVVSAEGRVVREQAVPVRDGPCIHDCGMTGRYVIVLDLPVTFSMRAVLGGHLFPFRWNARHPARLGLLPRDGTVVRWCALPPCFVFHVGNAFDAADGSVVLDVIAYDSMFASGASGLDALGRLERWTVDPVSGGVVRRVVDDTPQEFPRMDERRWAGEYSFLYTVAVPPDGDPQLSGATRVFKHDLVAGTREEHDFGPGMVPGEFVFVPGHAGAGEDEGWLLGLVIDTGRETTSLCVLDARRFSEGPVARVVLPFRVPPGFHGNWFPEG